MLSEKLKPRKCRRCKNEYEPKVEWQKYCGSSCRDAVANQKRAAILRRAQKIIDAQAVNQ